MNPTTKVLLAILLLVASPVFAEELALRPLEPIVTALLGEGEPDTSEMAYVAARGAALYTALSGYIDQNPRGEKDKALATALLRRGTSYLQVATLFGVRSKMSNEAVLGRVKALLGTYNQMIVASKQLNNEILSPAILAEMDTLKRIEPVILEMAQEIEKAASQRRD